jgi:hypothetical protein
MHKNWQVITKIENPWLRAAATHLSDVDALFLAKEFPNFFLPEGVQRRIPLSMVLTECSAQSDNGIVRMKNVLAHFDIPSFGWGYAGDTDLGLVLPKEWKKVARQLYVEGHGYDLLCVKKKPRFVDWNMVPHLVVEVGEFHEHGEIDEFRIAPSSFFDFDA